LKTFENALSSNALRTTLYLCKLRFMKQAGEILNEILSERKASNASYSLRAFARDLDLSATQLSNVINGHRGLSPKKAVIVAEKLSLDDRQKEWFYESLRAKFSPSKTQRLKAQSKVNELQSEPKAKFLDLDLFKVVSNWYHFALLELIKISVKEKNQISFFSKKLGISEIEIELALGRLERLNLVEKSQKLWIVAQDAVIADQGIPTEAVRNFHRQILEKAIQALAFQSKDERYGYSALMPVKVKSANRAKKLIQKFRSDFAKEISDQRNGEEIYGLSIQFFRLSQSIHEK
jgi:uncharacterized protein (TIGR02147 family)